MVNPMVCRDRPSAVSWLLELDRATVCLSGADNMRLVYMKAIIRYSCAHSDLCYWTPASHDMRMTKYWGYLMIPTGGPSLPSSLTHFEFRSQQCRTQLIIHLSTTGLMKRDPVS
jgi:hypothetical protein